MSGRQAHRLGADAEGRARAHLESRGLRCLECNYRTRRGEIDLIMRDGSELVFVEVRRRSRAGFGDGLDSVTPTKQRRLAAAAAHYLQRLRDANQSCRFDVVAVDGDGGMRWVRDAFRVDG